jgi:hypothetical protein
MKTGTKLLAFVSVAILAMASASAAPPPNADEEYKEFYHGLRVPNGYSGCCDESDCRPVQSRATKEGWKVFVDKETFGETAPDNWVLVPEKSIIVNPPKARRPVDAIVCWVNFKVLCFTPPTSMN